MRRRACCERDDSHLRNGLYRSPRDPAAASLARQLWLDSYTVGLFVNTAIAGRLQHIRIRPRQHPEHLEQILAALARIDDIRGRWPLERILQLEAPSLPYGATLVVITALLTAEMEQTLLDLRRREYAVVLLTVGQARPSTYLPNIQHRHLGGREEWFALESLAVDAGDMRLFGAATPLTNGAVTTETGGGGDDSPLPAPVGTVLPEERAGT